MTGKKPNRSDVAQNTVSLQKSSTAISTCVFTSIQTAHLTQTAEDCFQMKILSIYVRTNHRNGKVAIRIYLLNATNPGRKK